MKSTNNYLRLPNSKNKRRNSGSGQTTEQKSNAKGNEPKSACKTSSYGNSLGVSGHRREQRSASIASINSRPRR